MSFTAKITQIQTISGKQSPTVGLLPFLKNTFISSAKISLQELVKSLKFFEMTNKIKQEIKERFKILEKQYMLMDVVRKEFLSEGKIYKSEPVRFGKALYDIDLCRKETLL